MPDVPPVTGPKGFAVRNRIDRLRPCIKRRRTSQDPHRRSQSIVQNRARSGQDHIDRWGHCRCGRRLRFQDVHLARRPRQFPFPFTCERDDAEQRSVPFAATRQYAPMIRDRLPPAHPRQGRFSVRQPRRNQRHIAGLEVLRELSRPLQSNGRVRRMQIPKTQTHRRRRFFQKRVAPIPRPIARIPSFNRREHDAHPERGRQIVVVRIASRCSKNALKRQQDRFRPIRRGSNFNFAQIHVAIGVPIAPQRNRYHPGAATTSRADFGKWFFISRPLPLPHPSGNSRYVNTVHPCAFASSG